MFNQKDLKAEFQRLDLMLTPTLPCCRRSELTVTRSIQAEPRRSQSRSPVARHPSVVLDVDRASELWVSVFWGFHVHL